MIKSEPLKLVQCSHCGWVHFAVTRAYAEDEVDTFNAYFDKLSRLEQVFYYGGTRSIISNYENCFRCSRPGPFVPEDGTLGDGHTIGPIIYEEDEPMSIYPVRLSEWFPPGDENHSIVKFIVANGYSGNGRGCLHCKKIHMHWQEAWGHHALPWGYGAIWCREKCFRNYYRKK